MNDGWVTGYWNGLATKIRKVRGTVPEWDESYPPLAWWRDLCGLEVEAVEVVLDGVNFGGGRAYLYNTDGSGWFKVTEGKGSPRVEHKGLPDLIDIKVIGEE